MVDTRHITHMRLENFQAHRDTEIVFKPGINLITGTSDAGKSAILRALNFVFHNQPRGKSFIRHGTSETRVSVTFSDGTTVQRIKGELRNSYLLIHPDGTADAYDRIGNDIPAPIMDALGNPPTDEKHGPLAYSEQMAPLFLVALSSTELPRSLSELTGVDDFEEAAQILAKRGRSAERQAKESQQRVDEYMLQLDEYIDLDKNIEKFERIEDRLELIDKEVEAISSGEQFLQKYNDIIAQGRTAAISLKKAQKVSVLADRLLPIQSEFNLLDEAIRFIRLWDERDTQYNSASQLLAQATKVADSKFTIMLNRLMSDAKELQEAQTFLNEYETLYSTGKSIAEEQAVWQKKLLRIQAERSKIIEQMREQNMWCNACNRPLIDGDTTSHVH